MTLPVGASWGWTAGASPGRTGTRTALPCSFRGVRPGDSKTLFSASGDSGTPAWPVSSSSVRVASGLRGGRRGGASVSPFHMLVYDARPWNLRNNTHGPAGRDVLHGPLARIATRLASGTRESKVLTWRLTIPPE
jgi:hypothetical protein